MKKSLQDCLNCLIVSLFPVELVVLSKLLYINILSFYYIYYPFYETLRQSCKDFSFLSLAISLRSTLAKSLAIWKNVAIVFHPCFFSCSCRIVGCIPVCRSRRSFARGGRKPVSQPLRVRRKVRRQVSASCRSPDTPHAAARQPQARRAHMDRNKVRKPPTY